MEDDSNLLRAAEGFLVPLRAGDGFNQSSFEELCRTLKELARLLESSDSIPKRVANVLVDLWPGVQTCSYLYSGEEAKQIMKAADTLGDLTRDIMKV